MYIALDLELYGRFGSKRVKQFSSLSKFQERDEIFLGLAKWFELVGEIEKIEHEEEFRDTIKLEADALSVSFEINNKTIKVSLDINNETYCSFSYSANKDNIIIKFNKNHSNFIYSRTNYKKKSELLDPLYYEKFKIELFNEFCSYIRKKIPFYVDKYEHYYYCRKDLVELEYLDIIHNKVINEFFKRLEEGNYKNINKVSFISNENVDAIKNKFVENYLTEATEHIQFEIYQSNQGYFHNRDCITDMGAFSLPHGFDMSTKNSDKLQISLSSKENAEETKIRFKNAIPAYMQLLYSNKVPTTPTT